MVNVVVVAVVVVVMVVTYFPLADRRWRTTPREMLLLASVAGLAVFWFTYYWSILGR